MIDNQQIVFLIVTYLIASIPFGLILTKLYLKQDVRDHGSGNIGATNVTRVGGKKLGAITFLLDAMKGAIMVLLAINYYSGPDSGGENFDLFLALVAFIAVCGHIFPIYLKFKGGKGVATSIAVMLSIDFLVGSLVILVWFLVFFASRISAIASLTAIFSMIPLNYFLAFDRIYVYLSIALFALVLIRHKENISRMVAKKENKF